MEYLQKCFYKSTGWNEDNLYSHITATSQALLDFSIPTGAKIDISSKQTNHLASSFTLLNHRQINGSLAYFYLLAPLRNTPGTKNVSLQEAIAGFRIIEPLPSSHGPSIPARPLLLYGRMYFPGLALEAMIIKRISTNTQLLIKCVNNPMVEKGGTLVLYLQNNAPKFSKEFIYSTNEALLGLRCLYNFGHLRDHSFNQIIPKFDNSVFSVGTEIWYAALSMSPGLLTSFRYSTRSTTTGKPLTMTLSCNPIIGQISSTYNVKTSVASTFCSKYDFNFYSYASNLSLGFELYNYSQKPALFKPSIERPSLPTHPVINPIRNTENGFLIDPNIIANTEARADNDGVMGAFQSMVNASDFSSVLKASTSVNDQVIKILWEGRVKDFLISTGVRVGMNQANKPEVLRFGVAFSYAC